MSRTDIGAPSLAKWLRRVAGDGSVEWVTTPMHSSVLLDVADLMDENAKLRELVIILAACVYVDDCEKCPVNGAEYKVSEGFCYAARQRMRELGIEVDG